MALGLYDIVNRHQIYLEGLKLGQVQQFQPTIQALNKLIRDELSAVRFEQLSDMSKAALRAFLVKFKKALIGIYNPWLTNQVKWFERYMREDTELFGSIYSYAYDEDEYNKLKPENPVLPVFRQTEDQTAAVYATWKNALLGANGVLPIAMLTNMVALQVTQALQTIQRGYSSGWTKQQTIDALRGTGSAKYRDGLLNKFNNQVAASLNTVIQAAAVQANASVAVRVWNEYEWVSVLDDRTTKICRRLDGQHFVYGKGPLPPAHVNCRSDTKPWEGTATPDETFNMWASRQSEAFRKDAFDGRKTSTYEGTRPLTLEEFRAKAALIVSTEEG